MLLLDTNIVSEMRKVRLGKAHPEIVKWVEKLGMADLFISVITIHELEIGICRVERRDPQQGAVFRTWLESHVLPAFEGRILSIDTVVARRAAALHEPDPRPINDAFIAATALTHGMTVVTRNVADLKPMGVPTLNPWGNEG